MQGFYTLNYTRKDTQIKVLMLLNNNNLKNLIFTVFNQIPLTYPMRVFTC